MKPKQLLTGALAAIAICTAASSVFAVSFQQAAFDFGALRFTTGNAGLDANYACQAGACAISENNTTSVLDIQNAASNCIAVPAAGCAGFTWDATFFDATNYIGAVDPNAAVPFWAEDDWTLSQGPGSLIPDPTPLDAIDELFHPLTAEIQAGGIAPDLTVVDDATCEAKFYDDNAGAGITYGGTANVGGITGTAGVDFPVCIISTAAAGASPLLEDATMSNDVLWLITGGSNLQVGAGDVANINTNAQGCDGTLAGSATITINAGTQIFGTQGMLGGIEITRGSEIMAMGTTALPIVMSSADTAASGLGIDWTASTAPADILLAPNNFFGVEEFAGLILDGCAPVNSAPGLDVLSEAVEAGEVRNFGGSEPMDSSGVVQNVVIAESGAEFQVDEEVQGLTLEGVGAGTVIDGVHIHYSGDDGIEWFGGTVNAKRLVVSVMNDDGLDMDLGFQGLIQYALVLQADFLGERTIESDNFSDAAPDTLPRTMPTFSNVTLLGADGDDNKTSTGQLTRQGMGGFYDKMLIADQSPGDANLSYEDGCVDIDTAGAAGAAAVISGGELVWTQAHFDCTQGMGPQVAGPAFGNPALENDDDVGAMAALLLPAGLDIADAVLPSARRPDASGADVASFFGVMINADAELANGTGCLIKPVQAIDASYVYQTTDAANMLVGNANTPADIANGATQNFFYAFDPNAAITPTAVEMQSYCENLRAATSTPNLNQPVVGATAAAGLDVVGLVTAVDLVIPLGGAAANASGSANVGGAAGDITVSVDNSAVPDITCNVNETGVGAPGPTATITYAIGATASIDILCSSNGTAVANDPANNRLILNFMDGADIAGQTNFAVSTM